MNEVRIRSSARIHTALLNESGYQGRVDGSIGFSIDSPGWEVCVRKGTADNEVINIDSATTQQIELIKSRLSESYRLPYFSYQITGGIESHIGLGSKTALLMAFGNAVTRLFGLDVSPRAIATIAGRGGTSGIGYWASQRGGFLWDAGREFPNEKPTFSPSSFSACSPPELIASIDLPEFYVCHFRFAQKGIHGKDELLVFERFCPADHEDTKQLLALVAGLLVPSLLSKKEQNIQLALTHIQKLGLKAIEWSLQDSETLRFRDYWASRNTGIALCLSSMGPTMYCITQTPDLVLKIVDSYHVVPTHYQVSKVLNGKRT